MIRFTLILALCLIPAANAVEVDPLHSRDTPIKIKHKAGERVDAFYVVAVGGRVVWKTLPERHFLRDDTVTVIAAPPGEYIISTGGAKLIRVADDDGPSPDPSPDPKPDPKPEPEPEPADKILAKWAIWIEELDDRQLNPEASMVMMDPVLRRELEDKGIAVRAYDDDSTNGKRYGKYASERPALILMSEDGRDRMAFPAPKSVEAARKIIQDHVVR